jgi:hypothetical protein
MATTRSAILSMNVRSARLTLGLEVSFWKTRSSRLDATCLYVLCCRFRPSSANSARVCRISESITRLQDHRKPSAIVRKRQATGFRPERAFQMRIFGGRESHNLGFTRFSAARICCFLPMWSRKS